MTDLPAPLAEPLHILEPWPWAQALGWLLVAVALLLAGRWWLRRRRRGRAPAGREAEPAEPSDFATGVEEIRRRTRATGAYRRGCHELAGLLKRAVEPRVGAALDTLTAREIRGRLGDDALSRLLVRIADLRFGRRPPNAEDFDGTCERVLEVHRAMERSS